MKSQKKRGWRLPTNIGALAELGEEYVASQGAWQDVDPSRFTRGLADIFTLPFRRTGGSTVAAVEAMRNSGRTRRTRARRSSSRR